MQKNLPDYIDVLHIQSIIMSYFIMDYIDFTIQVRLIVSEQKDKSTHVLSRLLEHERQTISVLSLAWNETRFQFGHSMRVMFACFHPLDPVQMKIYAYPPTPK